MAVNYREIKCKQGVVYVIEHNLFKRYCTRDGMKYLKCQFTDCPGSGTISNNLFTAKHAHIPHAVMDNEISTLTLKETCRKRAAEEPAASLRDIFNAECRSMPAEVAQSVAFPALESSMYKRRRNLQTALPTTIDDVHEFMSNHRNAEAFYRGSVESDNNGHAFLFQTEKQLQLMKHSHDIWMDATFFTVPSLFK
jgi:hypothetical protein